MSDASEAAQLLRRAAIWELNIERAREYVDAAAALERKEVETQAELTRLREALAAASGIIHGDFS